ncbi:unnamed protein product [Porites evermanni]|uniref:PHD finger protein 14 n=1 Tax=Porites evermanni TaxID=104178 RepID=A0ABN8SAS0_9CNID|nr:unnamed protein product [Porites evermanni]
MGDYSQSKVRRILKRQICPLPVDVLEVQAFRATDNATNMADKEKEERDSFLRSILNRGPNKRQIKPAENNSLLQLALGEDSEDSEEDEDFQLNDEDDDDEGGSGSDQEEDDDKTENRDKGQLKKQEVEVSDDDDDEDEDDDDDDEDVQSEEAPSQTFTVGDLIEAMKTKKKIPVSQPSSVASSEVSASSKKVDILICGICLDDVSDEGDEIVECDNCGITVHEGCYGINDEDSDSGKSNDTDSPTELWFCDACKVGLLPDCELCPNLGGIFKETDTGQWVHLLCALYTPDVAFVKPEKLQCVTLSEVPPYKWGAKDCNLCEDERFCRTGVCIECDAGMCRTYFHVTWLQANHLLTKSSSDFRMTLKNGFGKCSLFASSANGRKFEWLPFFTVLSASFIYFQERVKHCLEAVRSDVQAKRMKNTPKYYTPSEKIPRLLNTCPGACRQLFKKAQLLGYTTGQTQSIVNVRRKWFVQPALTSEFVHYYHDRSARLKEMQERQEELESNNKRLQQEEQDLREKYHELTETIQLLAEDILERRQETTRLHRCLCKLAGKFLVAQRDLCRGYTPKMKVSLLQHAYAPYLSQESRFTNYPLWRPFSKSFQKRRGRRGKAEEKGANSAVRIGIQKNEDGSFTNKDEAFKTPHVQHVQNN